MIRPPGLGVRTTYPPFLSASACTSQNRMSVSRYIEVPVFMT